MVKFNYWDLIWGSRKKRLEFVGKSRKQIKNNTLWYLQNFGRAKWVKTEEIFDKTLVKTDLFKSKEGNNWFLFLGAKGQIASSAHLLRKDGHPIVAGKGKRGYRYADSGSTDFINVWDESLSAWQARKENIKKEQDNSEQLIDVLIRELRSKNRHEDAKKMVELKVKYYGRE